MKIYPIIFCLLIVFSTDGQQRNIRNCKFGDSPEIVIESEENLIFSSKRNKLTGNYEIINFYENIDSIKHLIISYEFEDNKLRTVQMLIGHKNKEATLILAVEEYNKFMREYFNFDRCHDTIEGCIEYKKKQANQVFLDEDMARWDGLVPFIAFVGKWGIDYYLTWTKRIITLRPLIMMAHTGEYFFTKTYHNYHYMQDIELLVSK